MRRICLAVLLTALSAGMARSAGYDDFTRGITLNQKGQSDDAIAAFSAAIAAADLAPALLPTAYRGRAVAYLRKAQCDRALPDLDAALALKPATEDFLWLHAAAADCAGKSDLVLADYAALLARGPDVDVYERRGRLYWRMANYAAAAADFSQAMTLKPDYAYDVLWLDVSRARGGVLDLAVAGRDAARTPSSDWPHPLLALYAGTLPPGAIPGAAVQGDAKSLGDRQCEADFYLGEWWLARQDAASAKPLLQRAAAQCPRNFVEYEISRIELGRLP